MVTLGSDSQANAALLYGLNGGLFCPEEVSAASTKVPRPKN